MTAEIQMPQQHIAIISHSGLHEPWREIVHMGTHLVFPRSHYNHQATTDCFYFIDISAFIGDEIPQEILEERVRAA